MMYSLFPKLTDILFAITVSLISLDGFIMSYDGECRVVALSPLQKQAKSVKNNQCTTMRQPDILSHCRSLNIFFIPLPKGGIEIFSRSKYVELSQCRSI